MATAFEQRQTRRVLGGIIHVDAVCMAWSFGFRNLKPGPDEMPFVPVTGQPFDHGRNSIVKALLDSDFQHLFFLDSDVVCPSDTVLRLLAHNLPIISGLYHRRSPPHGLPVAMKDGVHITPNGGLMEVDLVGAGCLLVHRSVFEKVPPQRPGKSWFDWRVDLRGLEPPPMPDEKCMSEDYTWNQHVRAHGYKIFVDTSIRCKHIGLGEADYQSLLPAEVRMHT